jgi:hypothetical protein
MRSPAVDGTAYTFPKQNEANAQNQHCSSHSCDCEQHRKKFLHCEEIHFNTRSTSLFDYSLKTLAEPSNGMPNYVRPGILF